MYASVTPYFKTVSCTSWNQALITSGSSQQKSCLRLCMLDSCGWRSLQSLTQFFPTCWRFSGCRLLILILAVFWTTACCGGNTGLPGAVSFEERVSFQQKCQPRLGPYIRPCLYAKVSLTQGMEINAVCFSRSAEGAVFTGANELSLKGKQDSAFTSFLEAIATREIKTMGV